MHNFFIFDSEKNISIVTKENFITVLIYAICQSNQLYSKLLYKMGDYLDL